MNNFDTPSLQACTHSHTKSRQYKKLYAYNIINQNNFHLSKIVYKQTYINDIFFFFAKVQIIINLPLGALKYIKRTLQ
jgi:hypothetical protein